MRVAVCALDRSNMKKTEKIQFSPDSVTDCRHISHTRARFDGFMERLMFS